MDLGNVYVPIHTFIMAYSFLYRDNLIYLTVLRESFFRVYAYVGSPPYSGGVNQNTDVGNLAGKFLIVTGESGVIVHYCEWRDVCCAQMKCFKIQGFIA